MDSENKFWLRLCGILGGVICLFTLICFYWDYKKDVDMARMGFQKTVVMGSDFTYFQKVPEHH